MIRQSFNAAYTLSANALQSHDPRQRPTGPAPARADIENVRLHTNDHLRGDMLFLVELCLLDIVISVTKIGAGMLAAEVEEIREKLAEQIAMALHSPFRPAALSPRL